MSDWQVGDLAVCVDSAPQNGDRLPSTGLTEGTVYTVTGTSNLLGFLDRCPLGLILAEIPLHSGRLGFCADRFRKILPDQHEACESEFVDLLKRSKRKVSA